MLDLTGHVAGALALNYPETPDSCLAAELALAVDVHEVFVCGLHRDLEQLGDEPLGQPDGLAVEPDLEVQASVLVDEQLSLGRILGKFTRHTQAPPGWRQ